MNSELKRDLGMGVIVAIIILSIMCLATAWG